MYVFSKLRLLHGSLVMIKIMKAVARCIFTMIINACNEIEFTLMSDEISALSQNLVPRTDRNSLKNHDASNARLLASDSVNQNENKNTPSVNCPIYNSQNGKKDTVGLLNIYGNVRNFPDVSCDDPNTLLQRTEPVKRTSDPVSLKFVNTSLAKIQYSSSPSDSATMTSLNRKIMHETNSIKIPIESTDSLKTANQVIKQDKSKISSLSVGRSSLEMNTSDGTEQLNIWNNNTYSGSPINCSQQIVKNSVGDSNPGLKTTKPVTKHIKSIFSHAFLGKACYKMNFSNKTDKFNKPNNKENEFRERISVNVQEKIVKYNFKSPSPNVVEFVPKNVHKAKKRILCSAKQFSKDYERNLHDAQQNFNTRDKELATESEGNSIVDDILCTKDKVRILSEIFENLENHHSMMAYRKPEIKTTSPLSKKNKKEEKLSSSNNNGNIKSCLNIENNEVKLKDLSSSQMVDSGASSDSFEENDIEKTVFQFSKEITKDKYFPSVQETLNDIKNNKRNYIDFLKAVHLKLYEIENDVLSLCKMRYCKTLMNNEDLKNIHSKLEDLLQFSAAVNAKLYHVKVETYVSEISELVLDTKYYIQQNMSNSNHMKLSSYLKQLTSSLNKNRDILFRANAAAIALKKQIQKTASVPMNELNGIKLRT